MRSVDKAAFVSLDAAAGLFRDAIDDLFASLPWYRIVLTHGMTDATVARFFQTGSALFPMQLTDRGRGFSSLTTPYTCRWRPLADEQRAFTDFARACRAWPVARLDALPNDWPHRAACIAAANDSGMAVRQFDHFGNWYEDVRGQTWASYLAARPGHLREMLRRKLRHDYAFDLVADSAHLEAGIAAFESVYQRSWKKPEPFPRFNAALMRAMAPLGLLRLGILRIGDATAAAQIWVVERDRATLLKLAHDESFKSASPGTVLTALMLQRLIDEEHVPEIDFGRGDDRYKSAWARQRRQRIGLVFANPGHPRGMAFLSRHALGRVRRALGR